MIDRTKLLYSIRIEVLQVWHICCYPVVQPDGHLIHMILIGLGVQCGALIKQLNKSFKGKKKGPLVTWMNTF